MKEEYVKYLEKYISKNDLNKALKRLQDGEAPQYIVGDVNFYGRDFIVNNNVLIPRFETELLVEKIINYIKKYFSKKVDILDVGTGSGCIAITLALELNVNVDALDISEDALKVARQNNNKNNSDVNFYKSNLLSDVQNKYDVIISNPPYLDKEEKIDKIVYDNEPHLALFADNHGLYCYEEMLKNIKNVVNDKFLIGFEIGYLQADSIKKLVNKYLDDVIISVEEDYSGKDRYLFVFSNNLLKF